MRIDASMANTHIYSSFASTKSSNKKSIISNTAYLSPIKHVKLPRNASTDNRFKQRDSSIPSTAT